MRLLGTHQRRLSDRARRRDLGFFWMKLTAARRTVLLCVVLVLSLLPSQVAQASPGEHRFSGQGVGWVCIGLPVVGCWVGVWVTVPVAIEATDAGGGSGRVVFGEDAARVVVDLDCVTFFSTRDGSEWLAASGTARDGRRHHLVAGENRVSSGAVQGGFLNWTARGNGPCGIELFEPYRSLSFLASRIELAPNGNAYPYPAFTVTCEGRVCTFDASASTDDGTITSYRWTFGDRKGRARGRTTTFEFPRRTQPRDHGYHVTLTVADDLGALAVDSQWIRVP